MVVATYNRLQLLKQLLGALEKQSLDRPHFEVIVTDDGSTDGTTDFLSDYERMNGPWFRFFSQQNDGPAAARNKGLYESSAEFIAFTDDDCVPSANWLESYLQFLDQHSELSGAGGPIYGKSNNVVSRYIDATRIMQPTTQNGSARYLITANACYRRAAVVEAGGFNTAIKWPGGEDPELGQRITQAGHRLGVCESAKVLHEHRDSVSSLWTSFFSYGKGSAIQRQGKRTSVLMDMMIKPLYRNYRMALRQGRGLFERMAFAFFGTVATVALCVGFMVQKRKNRRNVA